MRSHLCFDLSLMHGDCYYIKSMFIIMGNLVESNSNSEMNIISVSKSDEEDHNRAIVGTDSST